MEVLGMKILKQKRLAMGGERVMIHFDNSPVHRQNWGKADPDDPAPASVFTADFFLFPRNKRELAGLTFSLKTFKEWEGSCEPSWQETLPRHSGSGMIPAKSYQDCWLLCRE
jgi:hypothetical protein